MWGCTTMPCEAEMKARAAMYKSSGYAYITTFRHLNAHKIQQPGHVDPETLAI